jgi:hypothetical protein
MRKSKYHTMKKLMIILVLGSVFASGCNPDLLDTEPHNKYVQSNFWKSEAAANAYLTGAYAVLRYGGLYGGTATPLWEETATPNAYNYGNSDGWNAIAEGNQSATTNGIISARWGDCYGGIGRCNTFLANVDKVKMDDALKTRMKGEAHFLRALYYFNLENYWGDVPLILAPPDPATQDSLPRTPRTQVVQQILLDLDSAATVLPLSYGSADLGRATKGAALALKARVLLYEASPLLNTDHDKEKWGKAAAAANAVIEMKQYKLYPGYRDLFLPENENNKEVIFDVQFIYPDEGNSFDLIDRQYNSNAPLLGLAKAYEMDNGLPISDPVSGYDAANPYKDRDPRLYATIVYPGDTYMGTTVSDSRFAITGYGVEKYSIYTDAKPPAELADLKGGQSYTNYIVLRYADILLMYAEARNEYVGPDASVYDAINKVRARAGMPDIPMGLSQTDMRKAIHLERRIEFACEGYYYNDIRRWRTAEVVMNAPIYSWDGSEIEVRKFNPGRDYWWPIPQAQLDLNSHLKQNSGY